MRADRDSLAEGTKVTLKRDIGWFGSFSMGYADVGADIYLALGLVAAYAAGWAPVAFLVASITYVATGLAYAELATAYPYAGGAQVYSMKAFNDFAGFLAGWLVMLDYTVCMALFSIATTGYLTFFFPWLKTLVVTVALLGFQISFTGMGLTSFAFVVLLICINIIGIKESSILNELMVGLNLIVLSAVMVLGVLLAFNLNLFALQLSFVGSPEQFSHISYIWQGDINGQNLLYAVTLAMSSFIGIESIAQAAEETKRPDRTIPRATKMSVVSVLVFAVGLSALSIGVLPWQDLAANMDSPISALVQSFAVIGPVIVPIVAFTGFAICLVSANTGIIGVSRVAFSMSHFGLLPRWFSRVNAKTRTPVRAILVFGSIGAIMALVGQLDWVADLYNFGALLSYLLVNLSLIVLRHTDKDTHRAWEVPFNLRVRRKGRSYQIPIPTVIGAIACFSIWSLVMLFHPMGRLLGITWTSVGLLVYGVYRRRTGKPFFSREIGATIKPMTYKFNALVLIRPEEKEEVVESIRESLSTQFRLTLMSVVRTGRWHIPLSMADQYRELTMLDLRDMAKALSGFGFDVSVRVEVGPLARVISDTVLSPEYDFVVLLLRKGFKKAQKKDKEDLVSLVSSVAPGKIMVVRK